jgi:transcriptional regulator with XRE-family HTH domain
MMGIGSLKNKVKKKVYQNTNKVDYQEIGLFIKKRRKELNLTQDVISNGICSVSYLSKIENGQIYPNHMFVKEIMTKLEVDDDVLEQTIEEDKHLESLIAFMYYEREEELRGLEKQLKEVDGIIAFDLIRFAVSLFDDPYMSPNEIMLLEHMIPNMSRIELQLFLYLASLYFQGMEDHKTALELLLMAKDIIIKNEILMALIEESLYVLKQRLFIKNSSFEHFKLALEIHKKLFNTKRVYRLILIKIRFLSLEHPARAYEELMVLQSSQIARNNKDEFYYLKAFILFQMRRFKDAGLSLGKIQEDSPYYLKKMILMYEICLKEDDKDLSEQIKQTIQSISINHDSRKDHVYFRSISQNNIEMMKQYLRDIAIPFSIKTSDISMLQLYTNRLMDICYDNSRYKEAMTYHVKYMKVLTKIKDTLIGV